MEEYVEEVSTEEYIDDTDFTVNDAVFIGFLVAMICVIVVVVGKIFKNFHVKIGNKVEIGAETKEK